MHKVSAEIRTGKGKGASRRLRLENKIPGIVYGTEKDPISIVLQHNQFSKSMERESFFSQVITLSIAGDEEQVVLKDLQRHPYKTTVMHVDFQRVTEDQMLKTLVPLRFIGQEASPGVKSGGVISHHLNTVEIECLPKNIPEALEVDVSRMEVEELLHLSNIELPKGVNVTALKYGSRFDAPVAAIYKGKI